jgi:hypothetical protein
MIFSCFACLGAPYLQGQQNKNEEKQFNFHENGNFIRVEVGEKVKKNNFYSKSPLLDV